MSQIYKFLKEKEDQIENINKKIKGEDNPHIKLTLIEMKESLLEDKNKIMNIMLNIDNEKKEETIETKEKKPIKRKTDQIPEDNQNNINDEFDFKVKKEPKTGKVYYNFKKKKRK